MVHLSWPLHANMSGGGYLSDSVAAGLLHLLGAREISESRAWLPLRLALRQPPVRRLIASLPCFHLRGPCLSRGLCYLVSARFSAPRLRLLAFARICSRNLVSSLSLKPHVDFLGVRQEGFFLEGMAAEAVFPLALAARHFSPRSRTLGCVVFLLAPRAPMCKRSSQ